MTGQVTTHLELSAGARYAHDAQSFESVSSAYNGPTIYDSGYYSESAPSWRLAAKYQFTPDVMLYGQIATGFFPGGSQGSNPGDPPPVRGENLTNYESGVKARFLEGKGLIDVTVFDVSWTYIGTGHATSKGLELTSSYTSSHGLRLAYNAAYTRAAFDSVLPAADATLTGDQLNGVPTWGMSGTVDYGWDLEDLWHASVGGGARWIGWQYDSNPVQSRSLVGNPAVVLPGYSVIDMHGSVARGAFTARLFVRNLTDKRAYLNGVPIVDVMWPPNPVQILYKLVQPRTIGIGFDYTL
jgi:outer membrane receptor protein involved in Fe transport